KAVHAQQRQGGEHPEQRAEEGDLEGVHLFGGKPDRNHHQREQQRAQEHQQGGAHGRGEVHQLSPMTRGSGSSDTPKRSCTEAAIRRARASSSAPVAPPWLTSTRACRSDTPASPSRWPFQPQASISHAAESLRLVASAPGNTGRAACCSASASARSAGTMGFLKKLPALDRKSTRLNSSHVKI